jgi:hypothetical protein
MTWEETMELWEKQNGIPIVSFVKVDENTSVAHSKFVSDDEFVALLSRLDETA